MCSLKHPVSGPDPNAIYTGAGSGPSQSPISGVDSSLDKPPAPPTITTMEPTKFGKLLKVVMPLVKGGLQGGFGGNWQQPGSGFAAQQGFMQRQVQNAMQQQALKNQTANMQSEQQWRQAEAQRAEAQAQGVGRIYEADDANGERHTYRIKPDGTSEDLGKKTLPGKFVRGTDAGGIDVMDTRNGVISPVPDEEPEKHGNLPFPGEEDEPQLQPAPKTAPRSTRPLILPQGAEEVDEGGKVLATGKPKTFAPKSPRAGAAPKPDEGKVESRAQAALQYSGGDPEKAVQATQQNKYIPDAEKFAVIQRIRKLKSTAKKSSAFTRTPEQMKALATAPTE